MPRAARANVIGIAELDELSALGERDSEIREIVEVYLQSSKTSADEVTAALNARDRRSLEAAVHKLKGASSQVGAHAVAGLCAKMRDDAAAAPWGHWQSSWYKLLAEIESHNDQLGDALSRSSA